jgi:hypothetical protein
VGLTALASSSSASRVLRLRHFPAVTESLQEDSNPGPFGCRTELRKSGSQPIEQKGDAAFLFNIPHEGSERSLRKKIIHFEEDHSDPSILLLVYYGGHGVFDIRNRSIWTELATFP